MAIRWYVMPMETVTVNGKTIKRPEFLTTIAPTARWGWMPVKDGWGIGWVDLTTGQNTTYSASAGVLLMTANLATNLTSGAVTQLQTRLNARELPSSWVSTSVTWRNAIKRVLCYVMCLQRYWGEQRQSLNVGVPKTTLVSSLGQGVQDKLAVVSSTLNVPAFQAGDTIESMMQRWADTLMTRPIFIGGTEL